MPLILLAEDDSSTIDHVRSALASQGWLVKTVGTRDQALRAASEFAPQLVLVNDRLTGAEDLIRTFSRRSGGPGVVLLTAEDGDVAEASAASPDVDAILAKPLDAGDLIETIRLGLVNGKGKPAPLLVADSDQVFSSEEIFGDLLDDILDPTTVAETEAADTESAPEPVAQDEPDVAAEVVANIETPEPQPVAQDEPDVAAEVVANKAESIPVTGLEDLEEVVREGVEAWADSVHPTDIGEDQSDQLADLAQAAEVQPEPEMQSEEDLESKLEDTLAGVLAASLSHADTAATAPETPTKESSAIDALLSQALGDLDLGTPLTVPAVAEVAQSSIDEEIEALAASVEIEPIAEIEEPDVSAEIEELTGVGYEPEPLAAAAEIQEVEGQPEVEEELDIEPAPDPIVDEPEPAPDAAAPIVAAAPGFEFGEYTLEEQIGVGGMASVWKARRKGVEGFEKRVAIKKILPQAAENEDFVEMFIDEAKLAAQLNHSNITHIYDLGKIDDDYFIAMEYVEGKNLRQILDRSRKKQQPVPLGVALLIAARIADALDYAHRSKDFDDAELGLVHRDVSPQNVLLSYEGDIKLCDFGIAKAVSKISTTQMGALKGKLQYMSPEQAWGKSIDQRSDLFSLGALLYEMLSGERLFSGDSEMAVLESVREADVGTQIIQSPDIPAGVKGVLLRALAKEPEDRFQSAEELQRGLEELIKEESPTPGAKTLAAYVRDLLDMRSELPEIVTEDDPPQRLEIAEDLEWEPDADASDAEDESTPWLRRVLTRLLPVILVIAVGGGITAGLMQKQASSEQPPTERSSQVTEAPVVEPLAAGEEAAVAPQGQPPPASDGTDPTPPPPASPQPQESQPKPTPAKDPPPAKATPVVAAREPSGGASEPATDAALERQVEQDLRRVQELMATPVPAEEPAPEPPTLGSIWSDVTAADQADPKTQPGDLVQPGPGVIAPRELEFDLPEYTETARQAGAEGTVRITILVDENGRVTDVRLVEGLATPAGLEEALIESAYNAVYQPASKDGVPVKMWYQKAVLFEP